MSTQPGLFEAAEDARAAGLAQVEENTPDTWKTEAFAFLDRYARTHPTVFVDDLWAAGLPEPPNARALGPLILRAAREGLIAKTGAYRPSVRSNFSPILRPAREGLIAKTGDYRPSVRSNLSPKPVWRSLVYEDPAQPETRKATR